ncbi:glycosyltransferase family 4 protein [Anthocerotibacter panamensis]|uniref:glycosyltransferase family 4 protein n=1 Tax=Anthocerotibacter panamensis TaxID=2857077 RepID=UPI001C40213D|nr:glycosyltransferase family 1 protein [Anthocerotibacter panamensis]
MSLAPDESTVLLNQRILFSGYDLEQKVHRGIAFYAKSVLKATQALGATNHLLTSAPQEQAILPHLENPHTSSYRRVLWRYVASRAATMIPKPALTLEGRLSYLEDVAGFVNQPDFYRLVGVHTRLFDSPYPLEVKDFDLIFTPSPLNIRSATKVIQTLPDVIPLLRSDHNPDDVPKVFYRRVKNMLEYAHRIISISNFSRAELLTLFPAYEHKVVTLYPPVPIFPEEAALACDPSFQATVLKKYQLETEGYLLFIGTLEKRKNIARLITSYRAVQQKLRVPLILVGALGYGCEAFQPFLDGRQVRHLSYIPTADKLVLLKNALAFVFPSCYEGFGLPPLEAMQMNCPVLTSRIASLPEACGDAALYVDPHDTTSISDGLVALVSSPALRHDLIQRGAAMVARHSFANYKKNLLTLLTTL